MISYHTLVLLFRKGYIMILSHPNKPLKEHLQEVKLLGTSIFNNKHTVWHDDEKVRKTLEIILENHDAGKATKYFQDYIKDPEKYLCSNNAKLKSHAILSAFYYILFGAGKYF